MCLRPVQCEVRDGREVCFGADGEGGRDLCPPHVSALTLTTGAATTNGTGHLYWCQAVSAY
jgi:hypothetical protein